jgi:hypothetical protein
MRKLALLAVVMVLLSGCARTNINTGGKGYGFEGKRIYTVAVFPPAVAGSISPDEAQRDSLYTHLEDCLVLTGRFETVDRVLVETAVDPQKALSPDEARQAGKDFGADVVCLAGLTVERVSPPMVRANVDIMPVEGRSPSYKGSGRAGDPASWLRAAKLALDSASAKIVK